MPFPGPTYEERWYGIEQADLSQGRQQCEYVTPTGEEDHIRHCGRVVGHHGPHMDCYGYEHKRWYRDE